ncbi:MAG: GW dipeptide domain-containing protein [Bacteroidota bacterium]
MKKLIAASLFINLLLIACDSKPKVIQAEPQAVNVSANDLPVFKDLQPSSSPAASEHKVVVEEILNTEKYSYLHVSENSEKFWIAISKREVNTGDTYYYKGGLLKKNFYSREFDRVFETVYLVSNIWQKPEGANSTVSDNVPSKIHGGETLPDLKVQDIAHADGSIKLADLFSEKAKYNGQSIKITGRCVKVNPMIMNRNWLHIQDGTGDGLDLTVTTTEKVPLGAVVSLEGTISLDKDFGAGYRYDIIMEGAVVLLND